MAKKRRKLGRRIALRTLIALVVALPVVIALAWLAFQHKPGWYHPAVLDDVRADRARAEATTMADDVSGKIVHAEPFELTLTEREVNEWLAVLPQLAPEYQRSMPRELSMPAVSFEDGVVRLGTLCDIEGWRSVLSIGLRLGLSGDGRDVEVALIDARGGSLPVPQAALDRLFGAILDEERRLADERGRDERSTLDDALSRVSGVDDLYTGIKVRNRFVWPNGRRPIRIDSMSIGNGELRLRIEPL